MRSVNMRKAQLGGERLQVDSSNMRTKTSMRRDEDANTFEAWVKAPWPMPDGELAFRALQAVSSLSSESTSGDGDSFSAMDLDIPDTDSRSEKSDSDRSHNSLRNLTAPKPVGLVAKATEKPATVESQQPSAAHSAARPWHAKWPNASRKQAAKLALQRRGVGENRKGQSLMNSSPDAFAAAWNQAETKQAWTPDAFAAAWNQAETKQAWKQEEKACLNIELAWQDDEDSAQMNVPEVYAPEVYAPEAFEDMPLPRWCKQDMAVGHGLTNFQRDILAAEHRVQIERAEAEAKLSIADLRAEIFTAFVKGGLSKFGGPVGPVPTTDFANEPLQARTSVPRSAQEASRAFGGHGKQLRQRFA